MKKFLKKLSLFVAVIVAMNVLYVLLLLAFSPGFRKIYDIVRFENQQFDAIVLGNSMALDGIDAEYLSQKGLSTYNLAVAGDHVSTSLFLLEEYLKQNKKPEMVLVGLSSAIGKSYLNPVPFTNPEVEFFYHPNLWDNFTNPPLLNFQWLAVDLLKILISKDHRNATMVLGQWRTNKVIPDHTTFKANQEKGIDYRDPYLLKIIELCRKENIKVVLTELPGCNSNQNSLPVQYEVQLKNKQSHKVYNLNNNDVASQLINPAGDWLAQDHLNQSGGRKITAYLFEKILKEEMTTHQKNQSGS